MVKSDLVIAAENFEPQTDPGSHQLMLGSEVLNHGLLSGNKAMTLNSKFKKAQGLKKSNRKTKDADNTTRTANTHLEGLKIFSLIKSDGFFMLYDLFDNSPVLILPLLDSCLALDPCHHEWVNGTEYNRVYIYPVIKRVKKQAQGNQGILGLNFLGKMFQSEPTQTTDTLRTVQLKF